MIRKLSKLLKNESGITALETAIILIAFVVVASVFAFTILSAGTFSTERGKEAIYSGLEEVSSSMEIKGSVIAKTTTPITTYVESLVFTLANVSGGDPIDMTDTESNAGHDGEGVGAGDGYNVADQLGDSKVVVSYSDEDVYRPNVQWGVSWVVRNDTDTLLEAGELVQITIWLTNTAVYTNGVANNIFLGANKDFSLEVKPPSGGVVSIQKKTPASIDVVMDLH